MYHRVSHAELNDPYNIAVSPVNFREHLQVLNRHASPRPLRDVVDHRSTKSKHVAVTFDDGYSDNLYEALPLLEAEDISATIFIATGMLDGDGFWIDKLARCLLVDHGYPDNCMIQVGKNEIKLNLGTLEKRSATHRHLHSILRTLHPDLIEKTISSLAAVLQIDPTPPNNERPLSSQEVAKLASHPLIELGGHTVRHPYLTCLSISEQKWEIETCQDTLKALGAEESAAFAYPFGDHGSHSLITRLIVKRSGWHHAVVAGSRRNRYWLQRFAVPRHFVGNWDGEEFERRLIRWLRRG